MYRINVPSSIFMSLIYCLSLTTFLSNKQYVHLGRNISTWKRVKISFATRHEDGKWNTWNVQSDKQLSRTLSGADAQREKTGPVKKQVELLVNHFKEESSSRHQRRHNISVDGERQRPWSCLKAVASNTQGLLLPVNIWKDFSILLETAGSVAHRRCFSSSAPRGFARREIIFVTVGFSLACSVCSFYAYCDV